MKDPLGQLRLRFAGLRLVREHHHGQVYAGTEFSGGEVTVVVLDEVAAGDPDLRRGFAEAVRRHQRAAGSGEPAIHAANTQASVPWAASRDPAGERLAERLLASLAGPASPATDSLGGLPPLLDAPPPVPPPVEPLAAVFPDPTFAAPPPSQPPPSQPQPGQPPASPPPPRPASAPPLRPTAPAPRPMPPSSSAPPGGPSQHPYPQTAAGPRLPVRPRSSGASATAVVATVVIGVLLLMICCAGVAGSM